MGQKQGTKVVFSPPARTPWGTIYPLEPGVRGKRFLGRVEGRDKARRKCQKPVPNAECLKPFRCQIRRQCERAMLMDMASECRKPSYRGGRHARAVPMRKVQWQSAMIARILCAFRLAQTISSSARDIKPDWRREVEKDSFCPSLLLSAVRLHDSRDDLPAMNSEGRGERVESLRHLTPCQLISGQRRQRVSAPVDLARRMPADIQEHVCLTFALHVQHLREVWSHDGQGPRDEAPLVIAAVIPKVSKLRTRPVVNDVSTAAARMLSILPAPHQPHHSPQTEEVLRTDEGEEVQQRGPILSDRHTLHSSDLRRASTRLAQSFHIRSAQPHRCHWSAFHWEPGLRRHT